MRRRQLSPEERALWDRVASSAEPLHPMRKPLPVPPAPQAPPVPAKAPRPAAPSSAPSRQAPFRLGERAATAPRAVTPPAMPPHPPSRLDARTRSRLRKGRLAPDARIDLHGMTLAQAHRALIGFVLGARASGHRLVLVITGKGRERDNGPLPPGRGLLRRQVPDWLTLPPLADLVLDVTPAHRSHGGEGALYVWLRRR